MLLNAATVYPEPIRLCGDAPALRFAASELRRYLGRAFPGDAGAEGAPGQAGGFRLGLFENAGAAADLAAAGFTKSALAAAGPEAYAILVENERVCLYGARPRAVLAAVYAFLRDACGCVFALPGVELVPVLKERELAPSCRLEGPAFPVRGFGFHGVAEEAEPARLAGMIDWVAKLGFNRIQIDVRVWARVGGELGALLEERDLDLDLGIHSLNWFLPEQEHAGAHPDWYATVANRFGRQIRFSNLDSVPVAAGNLLRFLERTPAVKVLGLWPLDGTGFDPAEIATGEMGDLVLRYVNALAERIAAVRPDLVIDHLAYIGYAPPPKRTRPHPQILTSVCHYWDQTFTQPICDAWYGRGRWAPEDAKEKARGGFHPMRTHAECCRDLGGWVRLGPAAVFTYYVDHNLSGQVLFDVAGVIRSDLRYYRALGVKGGVTCYCMDPNDLWYFRNLQALAAFQWNPEADWTRLDEGLMKAVFGAAGPRMGAFYASLAQLHNEPLLAGFRLADLLRGIPATYVLSGYNPDLHEAVLRQVEDRLAGAFRVLESALEAMADDPDIRARVESVRHNLVMQRAFARLGCRVLAAFGCRDLAVAAAGDDKAALEARAQAYHDEALRLFNAWVEETRDTPARASLEGKITAYRVALEKDFRGMKA